MWTAYLQLILTSFSLGTDAFCVSVADGLAYKDINKKKLILIPIVFGLFQGLMPVIGYFLGISFYDIIKDFDHWIAFALLLFIGGKMLIEGIIGVIKKEKDEEKHFSVKQVIIQGIATSIDALAVGVALITSSIHIAINGAFICIITFIMCLIGILLGKQITKLLKGKIEIATIIGGIVLILIGTKVVLEHLGILVLG